MKSLAGRSHRDVTYLLCESPALMKPGDRFLMASVGSRLRSIFAYVGGTRGELQLASKLLPHPGLFWQFLLIVGPNQTLETLEYVC